MVYSKNLFWFKNVIWEEKGIELECLVDTTDKDVIQKEHWLIRVGATLKLLPTELLDDKENKNKKIIMGKAVRWNQKI